MCRMRSCYFVTQIDIVDDKPDEIKAIVRPASDESTYIIYN